MSICAQIQKCVDAGDLFPLVIDPALPRMDPDAIPRKMFVSKEIKAHIDGPWPSEEEERRCGDLRGDLEAFVNGDLISMCLTAYEHKTAYMGRLDMPKDEVWDIRSRDPSPALRVFGRFACADKFIAIYVRPRSVPVDWLTSLPLGGAESIQWQFAIIDTHTEWKRLFPNHEPPHGDDLGIYVSNNRHLV